MRLHWLLPDIKGIPVLMYHRVWPGQQDGLTLLPEQLRAQWLYLKEAGYEVLTLEHFLEIVDGGRPAPARAVLLTFDDGYRNNLTYVYPLLQEFGWQATIFIIGDTLDGTAAEVKAAIDEKLSPEELRQMDPAHIRFGLHGYHHENFSKCGHAEIQAAMDRSFSAFRQSGIGYVPVLAYPYGARPKDAQLMRQMKDYFKETGLKAAFRIGNKPERVPATDRYELKRIDIRGEDTLADFKIKLRKGKLKPF